MEQQKYNLPAVRSLTRAERKDLRKIGGDFVMENVQTDKNVNKMIDYVLDVVYADFDFSQIPQDVCNRFAIDVYRQTNSAPKKEEVKK
jgi:hypothetical protein